MYPNVEYKCVLVGYVYSLLEWCNKSKKKNAASWWIHSRSPEFTFRF